MSFIPWNDEKPRPNDQFKELPSIIRSNKSSLDSILQKHFYWSDTVASGGIPRESTTVPGNARAFYGARSTVSDPGYDGALFVVSDESRVLATLSSNSVLVGSSRALSYGTTLGSSAVNSRWVTATGVEDIGAATDQKISFGVTYDTAPVGVWATASAQAAASIGSYVVSVNTIGTSTFSAQMAYVGPGAPSFAGRFYWRSVGTVTNP